ncbi:MAG TPA: recombinase RecT [Planctomycetaceae bacterium]|nr:recombinase RecT [Planctomycetaceae bacterium]
MAKTEQLTVAKPMASAALAAFIGMDDSMMIDTIRAQCFAKTKKNAQGVYEQVEVTDFQVAAFISIAVEMKVNPLLPGMLYAYPVKGGGIVPIVGPDGVFKKLAEHPDVASWEVEVLPEDVKLPPTHAVAKIFRKGVERPVIYTALLSEWRIAENPNWVTRPRHMLQLRALKHAARQVIHGLPYDEDDRHIMEEVRVSPGEPGQEAAPERPDPAKLKRGKSGTSASTKEQPPIEAEIVPPKKPGDMTQTIDEARAPAPLELEKDVAGILTGATIISAKYENFGTPEKPKHGCKAEIEHPAFKGTAYDLNGGRLVATAEGSGPDILSLWQTKAPVDIAFTGKFSKVQKAVIMLVDNVQMTPAGTKAEGGLGIE